MRLYTYVSPHKTDGFPIQLYFVYCCGKTVYCRLMRSRRHTISHVCDPRIPEARSLLSYHHHDLSRSRRPTTTRTRNTNIESFKGLYSTLSIHIHLVLTLHLKSAKLSQPTAPPNNNASSTPLLSLTRSRPSLICRMRRRCGTVQVRTH